MAKEYVNSILPMYVRIIRTYGTWPNHFSIGRHSVTLFRRHSVGYYDDDDDDDIINNKMMYIHAYTMHRSG